MTAAVALAGLALFAAGIAREHPTGTLWIPGAALIALAWLWSLTYPARVNRRRRNRRGGWIR